MAGAAAITVTLPESDGGDAIIIGQGSNADGFEVLKAGNYNIVYRAVIDPDSSNGQRATPVLRIYEYDADISTAEPIGETDNRYVRTLRM